MIIPKQACRPQFIGTSLSTYYTPAAGDTANTGTWFVPTAWALHNTGSEAVSVTCFILPRGVNGALRVQKVNLGKDQTKTPWDLLHHTLNPGDSIQMLATKANAVVAWVSGFEWTQ